MKDNNKDFQITFDELVNNVMRLQVGGYVKLWWDLFTLAWDRGDMQMATMVLKNLAFEALYEASELTVVPIDQIAANVKDTFRRKNAAYGNNTLENFYRVERDFGINPEVGLITRMCDKMSRIENLEVNANLEQVGEALYDTYIDLGAYAMVLVLVINNNNPAFYNRKLEGYNYAQAISSVDDPVTSRGTVDEYRRAL